MMIRMKRKRKMQRRNMPVGVILGLVLVLGSSEVNANGDFRYLRRNDERRSTESRVHPDGNKGIGSQPISEMQELWEQASEAARLQLEAQRILFGSSSSSRDSHDFSMPSVPSRPSDRPPIWTPTSQPNIVPPSTSAVPGPTSLPNPSSPPTAGDVDCLQGRTREEYIFDILVDATSESLLTDVDSPQGKAFDYMANDDPFLSDPCIATTTTLRQRYALTTMYYSLGGEAWRDAESWLGDEEECLWAGIECGEGDSVTTIALCTFVRT